MAARPRLRQRRPEGVETAGGLRSRPWPERRLSAEVEAATAGADSKAALVRRCDGGGLEAEAERGKSGSWPGRLEGRGQAGPAVETTPARGGFGDGKSKRLLAGVSGPAALAMRRAVKRQLDGGAGPGGGSRRPPTRKGEAASRLAATEAGGSAGADQ